MKRVLAMALVIAAACKPVEGTPVVTAPTNECNTRAVLDQCAAYATSTTTASTLTCRPLAIDTQTRCDLGGPTFAYTMVVSVPEASLYGAGRTFAFRSADISALNATPNPRCVAPACFQLPSLVSAEGQYVMAKDIAPVLGLELAGDTSFPIQARFIPFAPGSATTEGTVVGLPLVDTYASTNVFQQTGAALVEYAAAVTVGNYQRIYYPEPPYDAYMPPLFEAFQVSGGYTEKASLSSANLDDPTGASRITTITRRDGLDGWQAWLEDSTTRRRISTLKTLGGTTDTEVLHTTGFNRPGAMVPSLVDHVDVVISPPQSYLAVPKLVNPIVQGSFGLKTVDYPVLPSPIKFSGLVGAGDNPSLLAPVSSNIVFTSTALQKIVATSVLPVLDTTLQYTTDVNTDDQGNFSTVLPPGQYDVVVSPVSGTGYATLRTTIDTSMGVVAVLKPPKRTTVTGRAVLADGRPLALATVRTLPTPGVTLGATDVAPRPTMTQTEPDGTFSFEADPGQYLLIVDPAPGTHFPRLVRARTLAQSDAESVSLGDVTVPIGSRFELTLKDPSDIANPITYALVRVFAQFADHPDRPAVEIASTTTDASGYVEISLTPPTD